MRSSSLLANVCLLASVYGQGPAPVKIDSGEIVGTFLPSGIKSWIGIPYAKSPPERFAPPQDPLPWSSPLTVTKPKPSCMQQFNNPPSARNMTIQIFSIPMPEESEDCLYLNVWAPSKKAPANGWPVMFWIYGGNLQFGHSSLPIYNGENLAARDVVLVSFNYRTNAFGFSGSPELQPQDNNAGFWDQRKALNWVQKNIAQFGGNPKKVLIFGESAGGFSVKQLIATPPSPLPFYAAIMQSQASGVRGGPESFKKLAAELGCGATGQLACVRAAPATKIKSIIEAQGLVFGPSPDGKTMVQDVRDNLKNGKAAKVPILIGTNKDEGTPFIAIGMSIPGASTSTILGNVAGSPDLGKAVVDMTSALYPKDKYPTAFASGSALFTEIAFQCPTNILSQALVKEGYSVRRYFYTGDFSEEYLFPNAGAFHSAEILPIFKTYNPKNTRLDNLSNVMQGIWTGFAKNPQAPIPNWPVLTNTETPVREFGTTSDKTITAASIDSHCSTIGPLAETQGI